MFGWYLPMLHGVGFAAASSTVKKPGGVSIQVVCPLWFWKVPARHGLMLMEPFESE
jgi:hypothetical protein